ncbi:MAG: hypothetical protein QM487_11755 [Candidatus Marithrix sp.]
MQTIKWIFGIILCLFGLYVAFCNWAFIILNIRNRKKGFGKFYSQGSIIGPVSWLVGCTLIPISLHIAIWFVFLVDPSTWIMGASLPFLIKELLNDKNS